MSATEQIIIEVDDSQLDETTDKLLQLTNQTEQTKKEVAVTKTDSEDVLASGDEVRGLGILQRRFLSQMPAVREAYQMLKMAERYSLPMLNMLVMIEVINLKMQELKRIEERLAEYRDLVMENKGNLTRTEYDRLWRQLESDYRGGVPP